MKNEGLGVSFYLAGNRLLKLPPIQLFVILYLPAIIVLSTRIGLTIGSFEVGMFPWTLIYLVWLLVLTKNLEMNHKELSSTSILLRVNIFVIIPLFWANTNLLFTKSEAESILLFFSGLLGITLQIS